MKILVICQYYYPEPFRISDICEALVQGGHEVTVITGTPNYPMGEIYEGYQKGAKMDEVIRGVRIHRCSIIPRKTGALHRFMNYYSYSYNSSKYVRKLENDYDVVFVNQLSPVMMAKAGIKYKKANHKKLVLYCLDLWPESLVAGGINKESLIYKIFHRISGKIYKQADKILVTSKAFADYFMNEFGIHNIKYLPQYAEDMFLPEACRKEPNGVFDLMFAGNIGSAQNIETIIEAAKKTKDDKIRWHIVGDGSEYQNLKKMAEGMPNILFYGRQPLEKMPEFYSMADAMLVTMQRDSMLSLTLPGKVQTYMAAGKPIIGAIDGETMSVIKEANCGLCGPAEDVDILVKNVRQIMSSEKLKYMAEKSREYYNVNFSKSAFISNLGRELADAKR